MKWYQGPWARGLATAAVTAASNAFLVTVTAPEVWDQLGGATVAKIVAISTGIAVAGYLKQSPLPPKRPTSPPPFPPMAGDHSMETAEEKED